MDIDEKITLLNDFIEDYDWDIMRYKRFNVDTKKLEKNREYAYKLKIELEKLKEIRMSNSRYKMLRGRIDYKPISKEISLVLAFSFFFTIFFFINPNLLWLVTYEMVLCVVQ